MPPRKFGEKREIRRRLDAERRDGHEARERKRRSAHRLDELADLPDRAPSLLLLFADVHLDMERRSAAGLVRLLHERVEERAAVDRVDRIEQLHGFGRLVRLEPADCMEPHVGEPREKRRPFGERLLHPILAEVALSGLDELGDLLGRSTLADCDQAYVRWIALRHARGAGDPFEDSLPSLCGATHGLGL